ncbi:MAG: hypothetical protein BWZ10_03474 [candidate division BRC1 bacterium ADurb.BinA364]|nr:MAG: hypothetical protein BWZ10_03474 [candidate division BRC1 bacterium ADurb.BinA364]
MPLEDLKEGANSLEGTCGVIENFGWGQWGLYSVILRVYYAPEAKPHATGRIVSPQPGQTIGDNPVIEIATEGGATRVDVVAHCLDLDYDGDGVFEEWVEAWHQAPRRGDPASIRHHVGTAEAGENGVFRIVWDTQWLPDQAPGGVSLVARIANADGTVFVSPIVDGLSLDRPERSVKLYVSNDVPEDFGVRVKGERSCAIDLPEAAELANAKAARLYVRTWNGSDELHLPLRFNAFEFPIGGVSHHYGESLTDIPTDHLQSGPNTFTIRSEFKLHDLELLWPGPMLLVEYAK